MARKRVQGKRTQGAQAVRTPGFQFHVLLWIAPLIALVVTPLYLHSIVNDLSAATDDNVVIAVALVLVLACISIAGFVLSRFFACRSQAFPLGLVGAQLVLAVIVISMLPSSSAGEDSRTVAPSPALASVRFLDRPRQMPPINDNTQNEQESRAVIYKDVPDIPAVLPSSATQVLEGWSDAGDGYCEDSETHQEFSSLAANDKTLQECAQMGLQHADSIAFDFTESNGGCDIRYPAGTFELGQPGYTWWGWGAGTKNPVGSGLQKHELPTHCYSKIVQTGGIGTPAKDVPYESAPPKQSEDLNTLIAKGKDRVSIVLACATEGTFMVKTIQSFCDRTPSETLHEIIVVDDGSEPPLQRLVADIPERCHLKMLRHSKTLGLMIAKQTGGDAATGEFINFFDCHVAPNVGWHKEMIEVLKAGPRRLAVPTIGDLDIDTWNERANSQVNSKCYIDFNAQFMWFEDESDYIPVISGGLVGMTRSWWMESGGYDRQMRGWGGENVDQSLRTWLCGGEILRAKSSRIAHMWRVPSDSRTSARYHHVTGVDNIGRAAASWFDAFQSKYKDGALLGDGAPDISDAIKLKETLGCKPFAFFLHRFRKLYLGGGLLPAKVFKIKSSTTGQCLQRSSNFVMSPCDAGSWFHLANQDPKNASNCCSGIRVWNAMECFDRLDAAGPLPYYCAITGHNDNQLYTWGADGVIRHPMTMQCLSVGPSNDLQSTRACDLASKWERTESFVPQETEIYLKEVQRLGLSPNSPDN